MSHVASDASLLSPSPSAALGSVVADPSTLDGSVVVFSAPVPVEVRHADDVDSCQGTLLHLHFKVMVLYSEEEPHAPESVRIELSREEDLFFHLYHSLQSRGFAALQARQKLLASFDDYPHIITTNLNNALRDPNNCMCVLYVHADGSARLDFVASLVGGLKFVEVLACDFVVTPGHIVREHVRYRYESLRSQVDTLQGRLREVTEAVRTKNPSLLLTIKRGAAASANSNSNASRTATPMRAATSQQQMQQQQMQQHGYPSHTFGSASSASSAAASPNRSYTQQQQHHPSAHSFSHPHTHASPVASMPPSRSQAFGSSGGGGPLAFSSSSGPRFR